MPNKQVEVDGSEAKAFDKFLAGEIFTSTDIQMNLEILCDDLGQPICRDTGGGGSCTIFTSDVGAIPTQRCPQRSV